MTIGERIKKLRMALKLTQEQFSSRLRITKGFLSNLEKGVRIPSEQLIRLISLEYVVSENWLIKGEGEMFLSPEEIMQDLKEFMGELAFYDTIGKFNKDFFLYVDEDKTPYDTRGEHDDPQLGKMINFLIDLYRVGDDNLKAWAQIQFERAFPADVLETAEKKRTESIGVSPLIHQAITKIDEI